MPKKVVPEKYESVEVMFSDEELVAVVRAGLLRIDSTTLTDKGVASLKAFLRKPQTKKKTKKG